MPTADWKRLGELLVRRRIELDPRYSNRKLFARERGLNYRIVTDLEHGIRGNYEDGTITAAEVAYRVAPGSLRRALAGGGLEALPPPVPLRAVPAAAAETAGTPAERERDRLLAEHPDDEVLPLLAAQSGKKVSMVVAEMLDWLGTQETPPPHARNGTAG